MRIQFEGGPWDGVEFECEPELVPDEIRFKSLRFTGEPGVAMAENGLDMVIDTTHEWREHHLYLAEPRKADEDGEPQECRYRYAPGKESKLIP